MLVSAFWFGVIATLAAEFVIATVHIIITDARDTRKEEEDERN